MRRLTLALLVLGCGCASGVQDRSAETALSVKFQGAELVTIRAGKAALTIGGRGLVKDEAGGVSGMMGKRVLFRSNQDRDVFSHGNWRLRRVGQQLEGKVEGYEARVTVSRSGDTLHMRGNVGLASLAIVLEPARLDIMLMDMGLNFAASPVLARGRRIYATGGHQYVLTIHQAALDRTDTAVEYLLLMAAVELLAHHRRIGDINKPGWIGAPPDHYQRKER